jgi:hypothetical protein
MHLGQRALVAHAGEPLMTEESIEHMAGVVAAKGSDAFWQVPIEELLPESLRGEAPRCLSPPPVKPAPAHRAPALDMACRFEHATVPAAAIAFGASLPCGWTCLQQLLCNGEHDPSYCTSQKRRR